MVREEDDGRYQVPKILLLVEKKSVRPGIKVQYTRDLTYVKRFVVEEFWYWYYKGLKGRGGDLFSVFGDTKYMYTYIRERYLLQTVGLSVHFFSAPVLGATIPQKKTGARIPLQHSAHVKVVADYLFAVFSFSFSSFKILLADG